MPEVTIDLIRIPIRGEGLFQKRSIRTIVIDAKKGITALIGRLARGKFKGKTRIRTYLFDKAKWTMDKAKAWIAEHKRELSTVSEQDVTYGDQAVALQTGDNGDMTVVGYAAVFDQPTEINSLFEGRFLEVIKPGTFAGSLKTRDIALLWAHDMGYPLARVANGTLELEEDDYGLRMTAQLPDNTRGHDTLYQIKRGDIDGMSFRIRITKHTWIEPEKRDDLPKREIFEADLVEVSFVTFPAFEGSIIVDTRSEDIGGEDDMVFDTVGSAEREIYLLGQEVLQ